MARSTRSCSQSHQPHDRANETAKLRNARRFQETTCSVLDSDAYTISGLQARGLMLEQQRIWDLVLLSCGLPFFTRDYCACFCWQEPCSLGVFHLSRLSLHLHAWLVSCQVGSGAYGCVASFVDTTVFVREETNSDDGDSSRQQNSCSGSHCEGSTKNGQEVASTTNKKLAVKKIGDLFRDLIDAKRIYREIKILKELKHDNIINLVEILDPQTPGK